MHTYGKQISKDEQSTNQSLEKNLYLVESVV